MLLFSDELAAISSKAEDKDKFPFPKSCSRSEADIYINKFWNVYSTCH